jgi:hypothetical protein
MEYAVRKRIQHLCSYISDKSAVMQHVSREFNVRLTMQDVEEAAKGRERLTRADLAPMTPSPPVVTHTWRGYDPLALALFKYHAARTAGPAQKYWLDRMNDSKAKPKPDISIQL